MRSMLLIAMGLLAVSALLAWAPWLTPEGAQSRARAAFEAGQRGIVDGCGFACTGCGPKEAHRALFGYRVELVYACGMLPADSPEFHRRTTFFVSSLGTVHR